MRLVFMHNLPVTIVYCVYCILNLESHFQVPMVQTFLIKIITKVNIFIYFLAVPVLHRCPIQYSITVPSYLNVHSFIYMTR